MAIHTTHHDILHTTPAAKGEVETLDKLSSSRKDLWRSEYKYRARVLELTEQHAAFANAANQTLETIASLEAARAQQLHGVVMGALEAHAVGAAAVSTAAALAVDAARRGTDEARAHVAQREGRGAGALAQAQAPELDRSPSAVKLMRRASQLNVESPSNCSRRSVSGLTPEAAAASQAAQSATAAKAAAAAAAAAPSSPSSGSSSLSGNGSGVIAADPSVPKPGPFPPNVNLIIAGRIERETSFWKKLLPVYCVLTKDKFFYIYSMDDVDLTSKTNEIMGGGTFSTATTKDPTAVRFALKQGKAIDDAEKVADAFYLTATQQEGKDMFELVYAPPGVFTSGWKFNFKCATVKDAADWVEAINAHKKVVMPKK